MSLLLKQTKSRSGRNQDKVQDAGFSIGTFPPPLTLKIHKLMLLDLLNLMVLFFSSSMRKQNIDGLVIARIMDKDFITSSRFKKQAAELKSETYLKEKVLFRVKKHVFFT
ncbi:hypothetical protein CS542_00220 [Pedobacter sp. IW39]|nr:hypothetical protein CS542_00220 [Pedobacter sp. IW39]